MTNKSSAQSTIDGVSRRTWLGGAAVTVCASCLMARGAMAEDKKTPKDKASYQDQPKGKEAMCSNCKFFIAPATCIVVEGKVSPSGWCQLFEKKSG